MKNIRLLPAAVFIGSNEHEVLIVSCCDRAVSVCRRLMWLYTISLFTLYGSQFKCKLSESNFGMFALMILRSSLNTGRMRRKLGHLVVS